MATRKPAKSAAKGTRSKKDAITSAKKSKNLKYDPNVDESMTVNTSMVAYSKSHLKAYGSYVVEDRAIPDFRDGMKPVQRKLIYSMYELGLRSNTKHKKSARVVGDVLGKYHPHGDAAAYGALVGLANTVPRMVDGQGNWGSPTDAAAAMRYTECRLTKFTDTFLLDPGYMKVITEEPNYDDTLKQPLVLPALLPLLLIIGNAGGVAYGVRGCNPAFTLESVVSVVSKLLQHTSVDEAGHVDVDVSPKKIVALCQKRLKIQAPYGSTCVSTEEELAEFIKTGRANLKYQPEIIADYSRKIIEIKSYAAGFASEDAVEKKANKISAFPDVARWGSDCGEKRPHAGPYGCYYYITPKRGIGEDAFFDLADKVRKTLTGSEFYNLGITIRSVGSVDFAYCKYGVLFTQWMKYRVQLELKYLDYLLSQAESQLNKLDLLLYAVINCDKILEAAKPALKSKDPAALMAKHLKVERSKAEAILQLPLMKLAKMEESDLRDKIAAVKAEIKQLLTDKKTPAPRIRSNLLKTVKPFIRG